MFQAPFAMSFFVMRDPPRTSLFAQVLVGKTCLSPGRFLGKSIQTTCHPPGISSHCPFPGLGRLPTAAAPVERIRPFRATRAALGLEDAGRPAARKHRSDIGDACFCWLTNMFVGARESVFAGIVCFFWGISAKGG